MMILILM